MFVLQKTDRFLDAPMDDAEHARQAVSFIAQDNSSSDLLNLGATKTIRVTLDQGGSPMRLGISPLAVSTAAFDIGHLQVEDVRC